MSYNFDDHLNTEKRKNTNPARLTNLLIVAGFLLLAGLLVYLLQDDQPLTPTITDAEIQSTVDARVAIALDIVNQQPTQVSSVVQQPTLAPPPVTPELVILLDGTELVSGAMVQGTITDEAYEQNYTFEGKANSPVVITMMGKDGDNGLQEPAIVLSDASGNKLVASANVEQAIGTKQTQIIAALLPADGVYMITATRKNARSGNAEGDYVLKLDSPANLNSTPSDSASDNNGLWKWYQVRENKPFTVNYHHFAGDFYPEVRVFTLSKDSALQEIGRLTGDQLTRGQIGSYGAEPVYLVAVGKTIESGYIQAKNYKPTSAGYQVFTEPSN